MAKSSAAKKSEAAADEGSGAAISLVQDDPLAFLGDEGVDMETGLEEADASDIKIASLKLNATGTNPEDGRPYPPDHFVNSLTGEARERVSLTIIDMRKTREWSEYVGPGYDTFCRSSDGVTGHYTRDGESRARQCKGCPDYEWRTLPSGKRGRNCGDVHVVLAEDNDDRSLSVVRWRSTALKPWRSYLSAHFIGKRIVNGRKGHIPLFAAPTILTAKIETNGSKAYAVPHFERGAFYTDREQVLYYRETLRAFRELRFGELDEAMSAAASDDTPSGSHDVDASDFRDDDGHDTVQPGAGNRF